MIEQEQLIEQLRRGEKPAGATVYHPGAFSRFLSFLVILASLLLFLCCTLYYGIAFLLLGQETLIRTSPWPMYTTYPFLAVLQILTLFLLPISVWFVEKRNRNMVLVLFPDGFVLYRPWEGKKAAKETRVAYATVAHITPEWRLSGIALGIHAQDGSREVVFLMTREKASVLIGERIIEDHQRFLSQTSSEGRC